MTLQDKARRVYEIGWRRLITQHPMMKRDELEEIIWELNFIELFCGEDFPSWANHCLPFYSSLRTGAFKPTCLYAGDTPQMRTLLEVIKQVFHTIQKNLQEGTQDGQE